MRRATAAATPTMVLPSPRKADENMIAAPYSWLAAEERSAPQNARISGQSAVSLTGQSGTAAATRLGGVETREALSAGLTTQKLLKFR